MASKTYSIAIIYIAPNAILYIAKKKKLTETQQTKQTYNDKYNTTSTKRGNQKNAKFKQLQKGQTNKQLKINLQ